MLGKDCGLHQFSRLDNDIFHGNILVEAGIAGQDRLDPFDDVHAVNHLAKYRVTPALGVLAGVVEEVVVGNIDEELGRGGVGIHGACHGNAASDILQAIIRFVLDRAGRVLFLHLGLKTAALNHEAIDHPVKDGVIVVALFYISQKVGDRFGRFLSIQFQLDITEVGMKNYHIHALDAVLLRADRASAGKNSC